MGQFDRLMPHPCHAYRCWLQSCFHGDQSQSTVKPVPRQTSVGFRTGLLGGGRVGDGGGGVQGRLELETALLFLAGQTRWQR